MPGAPATCTDDGLEDNDDAASATMIAPPIAQAGQACPVDDDYYELTAFSGETIVVIVEFSHAEGDINLQLFDSGLSVVADSLSTTDDESISYSVPSGGTFFVHVLNVNDTGSAVGNPYDLDVSIGNAATCPDDTLEEDDDPASNPTVVSVPNSYAGLTSCDVDDDWFAIDVSAGDVLQAFASFSHAEGDVDLHLFDLSTNEVGTGDSATDDETIQYASAATTTLLLQVTLAAASGAAAGNTYGLDLSSTPSASCVDDSYEDNDTSGAAAPVSPDSYFGLGSCPTDDDYFSFSVASGEAINVTTAFSTAEGNIDLTLFDPSGAVIGTGASTTDDEQVGSSGATAGTHTVLVELTADAGSVPGNSYDLEVFVGAAPGYTDALEEDDDAANATVVALPDSYSVLVCDQDDDWFAIDLTEAFELTAGAVFDHADGDVDLHLFDLDANLVASSTTATDNESISYVAASTDTHFLQVTLVADTGPTTGNPYDLSLSAVNTCNEDAFEDNDSELAAATISAGTTGGLVGCPEDGDFYGFAVTAGDTIDVDVLFSQAEGDINIQLIDPSGAAVTQSTSSTDNESLSHAAGSTGTYVLRVEMIQDLGPTAGSAYSIDLSIN